MYEVVSKSIISKQLYHNNIGKNFQNKQQTKNEKKRLTTTKSQSPPQPTTPTF
jgi:hypothetical protein